MFRNPHLCLVYLALILLQVLNVIAVVFTDMAGVTTLVMSLLHKVWSVFPDLILSPSTFLLLNIIWLCLMISLAPFIVLGKRWVGNLVIVMAIYQVMLGIYHFANSLFMHFEFQGLFSGIAQGILGLILMLEVFGYWITRKTT
jgi:hypothetical protein